MEFCDYNLDLTTLLCWRTFPYVITLIYICLSLRPESMASILTHSTRMPLAPGQNYYEMPKTQMDQTDSRPTRTFPNIQTAPPPYASASKQNPDFHDPTSTSVEELLVKPRSNLFKKSIQLVNPIAQPTDPHHSYRSLQGPLLPLSQTATSETKKIPNIGVAHIKEAVTMELG